MNGSIASDRVCAQQIDSKQRRSEKKRIDLLAALLRKLLILLAQVSLAAFLVLLFYLAAWAIWYRVPSTPWRTVDLRCAKTQRPYYLLFCASLADNPHGFPGHCYVVWSTVTSPNLEQADAVSFMPKHYLDQVRALWDSVPGMLEPHSARGNIRNLDMLMAVVSEDQYKRSLLTRSRWQPYPFKVGTRDCVNFARTIAASVGLHTVTPGRTFPQDYIRKLKAIN